MGSDTKIEWAHHTFNPWSGCEKVSAGCAHCYAAALPPGMRRHAEWGKDRPRVVASESYWRQPLAWDRAAEKAGERHRVFCASTADVFEAREDLDGARARLFYVIQTTPHLDWLLLTKRPEYAVEWWNRYAAIAYSEGHTNQWPANAWIGTSVEDQAAADARIPHLLKLPARVRFLSCEPLLGAVDLRGYVEPDLMQRAAGHLSRGRYPLSGPTEHSRVSWVIVGGESGRHARPMHPDWARSLRDQCAAAGVAYFFKQWGEWLPMDQGLPVGVSASAVRNIGTDGTNQDDGRYLWSSPNACMHRIGKHAAGRLLEGREWSEVPNVG